MIVGDLQRVAEVSLKKEPRAKGGKTYRFLLLVDGYLLPRRVLDPLELNLVLHIVLSLVGLVLRQLSLVLDVAKQHLVLIAFVA